MVESKIKKGFSIHESAREILDKYKQEQSFIDDLPLNLKSFKAKDNDVFIATFRKTGTTLLQQIVYQLKVITGAVPSDVQGKNFDDIGEVIPFVEAMPMHGIAKSKHRYFPRVWKSHASATDFPKMPDSTKFIVTVRDGLSVAPSLLDYYLEWAVGFKVRDTETRKTLYEYFFMERFLGYDRSEDHSLKYTRNKLKIGYYFKWVKDWIKEAEKNEKDILFLPYEDIVKDMQASIFMIARFLGISATKDQILEVMDRCDRKEMSNDSRFKDRIMAKCLGRDEFGGRRVRMPGDVSFKSIDLPKECIKAYNDMFEEVLSFKDYGSLKEFIRKLN